MYFNKKNWRTVVLSRTLKESFFVIANTTKVIMAGNIHYSRIAKVPSDLIIVHINGINVKHAIDIYAYTHSIDKVVFPELVIHEKKLTRLDKPS